MILAQHEPDVDEHADEPQEVEEEPNDPYEDEIHQDEYQALFFGDHVKDSDNYTDSGSDNDSYYYCK